MTVTSSLRCSEPLVKSDPLGLWLRTLLESSRWSSRARFLRWQVQPLFSTRLTTFEDDTNCERPLPCNASAQTLKVTDMPSSRCLFRLVPSEPHTDETECLLSHDGKTKDLLPTPTTTDYNTTQSEESKQACLERRAREGKTAYPSKFNALRQLARENVLPMPKMLPTPMAWDGERGGARKVNGKTTETPWQYSATLKDLAKSELLPTPRANVVNGCDLDNPKLAERHKSNLEEEVAKMVVDGLLPTPLAGEYRDAAITENNATKGITDNISRVVSRLALGINKDGSSMDGVTPTVQDSKDGKTSRLSPLFTEEMMGFPLMWTALPFLSESGAPKPSKPTATPSFPK